MRRISLFAGALALFLTQAAGAQSGGASNRAAAEALFNAGRSLAASGKYAEACPKFEASQQLDPGLGTLLNLAECYEKLGKTASAWAEYREAIPLARASGSKVRQDLATERAAALESRLSMLTIRAMGGSEEASGLEIRRDGLPVQPAELGSPIPVDPGPHTIEAVAPGKQKWSSTVQITDAAKLAVEVPALEPLTTDTVAPAAKPVEAPPPEPAAHSGSAQRTAGIVVGAAGIVGLGIGTVFGISASSKWSDAKSKCTAYPYGCSQDSLDARASAESKASVATVAFIVGGVALAGGAVLWFTAGSSQEKTVALGVGPGAAFVRGSF
ncbi:MAG: tetratricopeptide repeat protein [Pseudomonadota bacterium]